MKFFREILAVAIVAVALFVSGCDKGGDVDGTQRENTAVTYYTIDGVWMLEEWNGAPLVDGTLLYVALDRKEHRFEMWDNINSMYPTMQSGGFVLSVDDMDRDIISGWYDYGVGDWSNDYIVELNGEGDRMVWRAVSGNEEMLFVEVEELPEF
ncbi:MAG: hypothetical protein J6U93_00185 [Alistipes sp.]|nr:hypothetical protein [Alistipes sp.]